jgi:outer membrane protein TolC
MRCKLPLVALMTLFLALSGGCKQRCFLTEADYNQTTTTLLDGIQLDPKLPYQALLPQIETPPTLNNLDRKVRFLSLAEAVAIALEQGTVGQPSLLFPGTAQDNLVQFTGRGVTSSDAIRVLALDPARAGSDIESSLSKFDAVIQTSMQWQTTDNPVGTPLQTFQSGSVTSISQTDATFNSSLLKPLPTGGVAGIVLNVPYQFTNLPARVNPSYRPSLQFQFEQPLLQGFGVEINQLRASHPGSLLNPGVISQNASTEGILITRIRFDQQRAEFERNINQMLLNVEVAYWNLYGSYWTLYSREQGLRFAFEAFKLNKARYEAGRATAADFYQSRGQYELFRAQRLAAIDTVLENERQLRALLGMTVSDGCRLMPSDSPTLAPYLPDWDQAMVEALARRPELYMARQEVKASQMNLMLAKNQLLPDLRFLATYDVNSIGNRLDGPNNSTGTETNAFRNLADNNFNNASAQLRLTMPIGFRFAHVQVRQAQIALSRSMETLKDQERKTASFMSVQYRRLSTAYEQIRANRAQREAFGEQLRARQQEFLAGRGTLDTLLEAQRFWADALANEFQQIVAYNNALAGFEFAKGTILQHDNVAISEGPLPQCASVRAVEHERARTASIVLAERAEPIAPACFKPEPMMPGKAPSLPSALQAVPPLKDAPMLPAVPTEANKAQPPVEAKMDELFSDAPPALTQVPAKPAAKPVVAPAPVQPIRLPVRKPSDFGSDAR